MLAPLPRLGFSVVSGQGNSLLLSTLVSLCGGVSLRGAWLSSLQGLLDQASSCSGTAFGLLCSEANWFSCPLTLTSYSIFFVDNAKCGCVVCLRWRWWLLVPPFFQRGPCWNGFTAVDKKRAKFCLDCWLHDCFDDYWYCGDCSIVWGFCSIICHEEVSSRSASILFFWEVQCIPESSENHGACAVCNDSVTVCGCVV